MTAAALPLELAPAPRHWAGALALALAAHLGLLALLGRPPLERAGPEEAAAIVLGGARLPVARLDPLSPPPLAAPRAALPAPAPQQRPAQPIAAAAAVPPARAVAAPLAAPAAPAVAATAPPPVPPSPPTAGPPQAASAVAARPALAAPLASATPPAPAQVAALPAPLAPAAVASSSPAPAATLPRAAATAVPVEVRPLAPAAAAPPPPQPGPAPAVVAARPADAAPAVAAAAPPAAAALPRSAAPGPAPALAPAAALAAPLAPGPAAPVGAAPAPPAAAPIAPPAGPAAGAPSAAPAAPRGASVAQQAQLAARPEAARRACAEAGALGWPFCEFLALLPGAAEDPAAVRLNRDEGVYNKGDFVVVTATPPAGLGSGHLHLMFVTGTGAVGVVQPNRFYKTTAAAGGRPVRVGVEAAENRQGVPDQIVADEPYGYNLVVALFTRRPLAGWPPREVMQLDTAVNSLARALPRGERPWAAWRLVEVRPRG